MVIIILTVDNRCRSRFAISQYTFFKSVKKHFLVIQFSRYYHSSYVEWIIPPSYTSPGRLEEEGKLPPIPASWSHINHSATFTVFLDRRWRRPTVVIGVNFRARTTNRSPFSLFPTLVNIRHWYHAILSTDDVKPLSD